MVGAFFDEASFNAQLVYWPPQPHSIPGVVCGVIDVSHGLSSLLAVENSNDLCAFVSGPRLIIWFTFYRFFFVCFFFTHRVSSRNLAEKCSEANIALEAPVMCLEAPRLLFAQLAEVWVRGFV